MNPENSGEYQLLLAEIRHLRKRIKDRDKLLAQALKLQRTETDRRLVILNNEHLNIKDNQSKSVLREVYYSEQSEQDKKIEILTQFKSNQQGRQTIILLGWGIIMVLISAAISFVISKM